MPRKFFVSVLLCLVVVPVIVQAASQDYWTAYDYTIRFYPRWCSYNLNTNSRTNMMVGPNGMGPEFKAIVAVNDDTIYALSFLDLSNEPQILTIPAYANPYSVLLLDVFGNVFGSGSMPATTAPTRYGLTGPNYSGTLPDGIAPVRFPYNFSIMILRADKYSAAGDDLIQAATAFRVAIQMKGLAEYIQNPVGGHTFVAPLKFFDRPWKRTADEAIFTSPTDFLATLQTAMGSSTTEPLSASDKILMAQFNSCFAAAVLQTDDPYYTALSDIIEGTQAAHGAIVDRWRSHTGPTRWVHFNNIGTWGDQYLDRAALTEYLLFANDKNAAYYAHAFVDADNLPLDGDYAYILTFKADELPEYSRFFSVTAYTPDDIELIENAYNKYLVASYTPGLVKSADGSITIYVQSTPPTKAPLANWLPVKSGPFNLMMRVYGPQGSAKEGTYYPPAIKWEMLGGY
jgi:hypothetical protein